MESSTTSRRVLGDLSVNTPTSRLPSHSPKSKRQMTQVEDVQQSPKRRNTSGSVESGLFMDAQLSALARDSTDHEKNEGTMQLQGSVSPKSIDNRCSSLSASPSASSPSSSFGHSFAEMNDTQNTVLTEPDDAPAVATLQPTPVILTPGELRQKAREMKIRLRFASYKVRTNQIDIPLSRLQIRSSTASPRLPSLPRVASNASLHRTPIPPRTATTNIPNIELQKPSAEKKQVSAPAIPSSPPSYKEGDRPGSPSKTADDTPLEEFATPLLPRQRRGLLNPPALGSPVWEDRRSAGNDLTSSVVKGRAADGLLSLMRHQI